MRPTTALLGLNKTLRSTIKQRLKQNIHRTKTPQLGRHTKYGGYVIDYDKVRSYVVPADLKTFPLTPFVTRRIQPSPAVNGRRLNGKSYLQQWKAMNGED